MQNYLHMHKIKEGDLSFSMQLLFRTFIDKMNENHIHVLAI